MTADFYDEDFRVLTPEAFEFVLTNELKRAVRAQNFLTLLLMDASADEAPAGEDPVQEIARVVSDELRETDLLARTGEQRLAMVLLDADLSGSMRVVDRLLARLEHYGFAKPLSIAVGAACCPTHATDPESLRRHAAARPIVTRRTRGTPHPNAS
jgi:GGDEF domain-containing protein